MLRRPFSVTLENLVRYTPHHSNIEEQIRAAQNYLRLSKLNTAWIFLATQVGYAPALVQRTQRHFFITPTPALHGVGDLISGDSYTDLRNILRLGFRSDCDVPNASLQPYHPMQRNRGNVNAAAHHR